MTKAPYWVQYTIVWLYAFVLSFLTEFVASMQVMLLIIAGCSILGLLMGSPLLLTVWAVTKLTALMFVGISAILGAIRATLGARVLMQAS